MTRAAALMSVLLLAAGSAPAGAAPPDKARDSRWRSIDFEQFRPIDDHSFYMRTRGNRYFLITTSQCPNLIEPQSRLITQVRGSDLICGPVDWDLRVGEGGVTGFAEPCIVQSQRELTPSEVAAIPKALKP